MAVDVLTGIDINCSLEEVSTYSADPDNAPRWYKNIQTVDWITDKPLAVGSRIATKVPTVSRPCKVIGVDPRPACFSAIKYRGHAKRTARLGLANRAVAGIRHDWFG